MNTLKWWLHAKYQKFIVFFTYSILHPPLKFHTMQLRAAKMSRNYSKTQEYLKLHLHIHTELFETDSLLIYRINNHWCSKIRNPAHNCNSLWILFSSEGWATLNTLRSDRLHGHTKHLIIAKSCIPAGDLSQPVKIETFLQRVLSVYASVWVWY